MVTVMQEQEIRLAGSTVWIIRELCAYVGDNTLLNRFRIIVPLSNIPGGTVLKDYTGNTVQTPQWRNALFQITVSYRRSVAAVGGS